VLGICGMSARRETEQADLPSAFTFSSRSS
jgi:hypothetical protein